MEPTNNDRANWANLAVESMALETGSQNEPLEDKIGDLLCDLRHLCDAEGLSFANIDKGSARCYREERREQGVAEMRHET